ncbi:MAG: hypothetical protein E6R03_06355 [Hyphomicrobiaceae bacterium]|nr:MAG: hypothetical protein E6R03_06355 [Hyphomicrobiaceae bacterium]
MNDQAFAAAAERLALAREIKRQEANARALDEMIRRKKARLAELERADSARMVGGILDYVTAVAS